MAEKIKTGPGVDNAAINHEPKLHTQTDTKHVEMLADVFKSSGESLWEKLDAFPKYVPRQALSKFLVRYEIFKQVLNVNGSIVDCGTHNGAGLFTFAKLSAIFEPTNHTRKVIGFDTFEGYPSVSEQDTDTGFSSNLHSGGMNPGANLTDLEDAVRVFDTNRNLNHIPKIDLVQGDINITASEYVKKNPHLIVSLLYLDMDLYEPTKTAIETFVPKMPKGAIIVFDELNTALFPGETLALVDSLGINNLRLQRSPIDPYISYAILS